MGSITDKLNQDLKTALLAGQKEKVETLKGLKSALQYAVTPPSAEAVAAMPDDAVLAVFQKEAKKRQDSIDMYAKAGENERAAKELSEKEIIAEYLPEQMSEDEIRALIDTAAADMGGVSRETMGKIIGAVKAASQGRADGGVIAKLVQERTTTK